MWRKGQRAQRTVTSEETMRRYRGKNVTHVNKIIENRTIAVLLISVYRIEDDTSVQWEANVTKMLRTEIC